MLRNHGSSSGEEDVAAASAIPLARTTSNADFVKRVWSEYGEKRKQELDNLDGKTIFLAYAWENENPEEDYCVRLARDIRRFGLSTVTAIEKNKHESIDSFFEKHVSYAALSAPNNYAMLLFSRMLLKKYSSPVQNGAPEPIIKGEVDAIIQLMRYHELQSKIIFAIIDGEETEAIPSKLMSFPRINFRDANHEKSDRTSEAYVMALRQIFEKIVSHTEQETLSQTLQSQEMPEPPYKRAHSTSDLVEWRSVARSKHRILTNLVPLDNYVETSNMKTNITYLQELAMRFQNEGKHIFTVKGQKHVGKKALCQEYAKQAIHNKSYEIIWFSSLANGVEGLKDSYVALLKKLKVKISASETSLEILHGRVKENIEQRKALLIFEDVTRVLYDSIKPYLIQSLEVHLLFSSTETLSGIPYLELVPMQPNEAKRLLKSLHQGSPNYDEEDYLNQYSIGFERLNYLPGLIRELNLDEKNELVEKIVRSTSWAQSNALIEKLLEDKHFLLLQSTDAEKLLKAEQENIEVKGAFETRRLLSELKRLFPNLSS